MAARDRFERELVLEGELDDEQRARLVEIANRCPVHLTLECGADVVTTVSHVPPTVVLEADHRLHAGHMAQTCSAGA